MESSKDLNVQFYRFRDDQRHQCNGDRTRKHTLSFSLECAGPLLASSSPRAGMAWIPNPDLKRTQKRLLTSRIWNPARISRTWRIPRISEMLRNPMISGRSRTSQMSGTSRTSGTPRRHDDPCSRSRPRARLGLFSKEIVSVRNLAKQFNFENQMSKPV